MNSPPESSISDYDLVQGHPYVIKMLKTIEICKIGAKSTEQH